MYGNTRYLLQNALCALLAVVLAATMLAVPNAAQAAANMVPNYEVKLLLDPDVVLNSDNKLKSSVRDAFDMPSTVTKMNVQFMDTDDRDLYDNGWSARIRKIEDEDDFELTYKKRYPIVGGNINAALTQANQEGFDSTDTNYEAQVEWGYANKTLSISTKKTGKKSGYSGMELPSASHSRDMLIDKIPGKLDRWLYDGWGEDMLDDSRKYGPVLAKRSIGTWNGTKLYIEVWPIQNAAGTGIEYVVEASFKTDTESDAAAKQALLAAYLQSQGWFLAEDSLKTSLIMERY